MKPSRSALLLLCFALTACPAADPPQAPPPQPPSEPGPTPDPGPADELTQLGVVRFADLKDAGVETSTRTSSGVFFEIAATPVDAIENFELVEECFVEAYTFDLPVEPPPAEEPVVWLDAGPQLTATAAGSTYAVLEKVEEGGDVVYLTTFDAVLPPLPTAAFTLEIPGAEFPAWTATVSGAAADLRLTSPEGLETITPETTFGWEAAAADDALAYLTLYATQTLSDTRGVDVFCVLEDDGAFSFSPQTRADMQTNGFTAGTLFFGARTLERVEVQGDAALILSTEELTLYDLGGVQPFARERARRERYGLQSQYEDLLRGRRPLFGRE